MFNKIQQIFKKEPESYIGLDINSDSVTSVTLCNIDSNYSLEDYAINNDLSTYKNQAVTIAVPYSATFNKVLQLDMSLSEADIEHYLTINMQKLTGFKAQDINMDFRVLGKSKKAQHKIDIELVAAKKELIEDRISQLEKFDVKLRAIDIESFALQRAALLQLPDDEYITAVINIKQQTLLLCVLQHNEILYIKEETLFSKEHISRQINHELEMLTAANSVTVDRILLAGEIEEVILEINIPVFKANPFMHIKINEKIDRDILYQKAPLLMVSCGLALWYTEYD